MVADQEVAGQAMEGRKEIQRVIAHHEPALLLQFVGLIFLSCLLASSEVLHEAAVVVLHLDGDVVDLVAGIEEHLAFGRLVLRVLPSIYRG